jgi:hypothetical protein
MIRSKAWILALVAPLALGTAITWWLTRGPEGQVAAPSQGSLEAAARKEAQRDPRAGELLKLFREKGTEASSKLVDFYAGLAGDPSATTLRGLALRALFNEPSRPLRLKRVLEAVAADPTPPREDPLWPDIVTPLSEQWTPEVFDKGRDLMLMEKRPRAKQALVASFAELATEHGDRFTPEQRQGLLTDFIDTYPVAEPEQKPAIEQAVRKIAGDDTADLLTGRGLNDGHKLKIQAEYERELQAGVNSLLKGNPNATD